MVGKKPKKIKKNKIGEMISPDLEYTAISIQTRLLKQLEQYYFKEMFMTSRTQMVKYILLEDLKKIKQIDGGAKK